MFAAMLPLFFQVSAWVDPMTSFCPWLELTLLFIVLSIDSFAVSLATRGVVRLILALFFFTCGLAVWEIVLAVTLLAAVLAAFSWRRAPRIALWGLGGYDLISLAFVGLNLYLKARSTDLYSGTAIKFSAASVKTFFMQLTAAVPFTYFAWDANNVFHQNEWPEASAWLIALFIVVTTAALVWNTPMHMGSVRDHGLLRGGGADRRRTGWPRDSGARVPGAWPAARCCPGRPRAGGSGVPGWCRAGKPKASHARPAR